MTQGTSIAVVRLPAGSCSAWRANRSSPTRSSALAVIALLATPAVALVTSAYELRRDSADSGSHGGLVLVVLAAATTLLALIRYAAG